MSFILDALRKSETERQRQSAPGIADAGYRPPAPRRTLWMPVLVTILVANMILLAAFWWRGPNRSSVPVAATSSEPVAPPAPAPRVVTPASAARAGGAEDAAPDLPGDQQSSGRTEILEPPGSAMPSGTEATAGGAVTSMAPGSTAELPSADQLTATGVLTGPTLHLDLHVYAAKVPDRFVFINSKKYTEGAEVQEGVRIEQITPDGVILSRNGTRFMLSRE